MKEVMNELINEAMEYKKCVIKRIEIPPKSTFDERDPRSPAIRPDPIPIRTVADILKELRNTSTPENNLGIRI
jgi:hypothetical protein